MKKIFTLSLSVLLVLLTVVWQTLSAQTVLFHEEFEGGVLPAGWTVVDADGDGYGWETGSAGISGHNSTACFFSRSWLQETSAALTPDNWLITPAVTLTSDATLSFWVCAQDVNYAAEHYGVYISTTGTATTDFTLLYEETLDANGGAKAQGLWKQKTVDLSEYTGQTVRIAFRHFDCTDQFVIDLDDVEIKVQPTGPVISVLSASIDFGSVVAGSICTAQTLILIGYNLTTDVSVTATVPFEVSADGSVFASSVTIPAVGGTLYVRYAPSTQGVHTGVVTCASTGAADATVSLSGLAVDCSQTALSYNCSFDNDTQVLCWETIDANSDGKSFSMDTEHGYTVYTYNSSNAADDWLISPVFALTGNQIASFDYYSGSNDYPEKFQAFAIGGDTVVLTPVVIVTSTTVQTQWLNLQGLNGNYRIGIHCVSDADEYNLYVDEFSLTSFDGLLVTVDSVDFGYQTLNVSSLPQQVDVIGMSLPSGITVTASDQFEVSADGISFADTITLPATGGTLFVRFMPLMAGTQAGLVTLTCDTLSSEIIVSGFGMGNYLQIVYVTPNGAGNGTGESWGNAMSSIEDAQSVASLVGAAVWVAAGTYYGDTTSFSAFTMHDGVNVYGGFAGNEPADYDLSLRNLETNITVLDGQNVRRVLYQPSSFAIQTTWDGFTIQNGYTTGSGGGVYLNGKGKLNRCVIRNNRAYSGGGVYAYSSATVSNCLIANNTASNYGGGVYNDYYSTITNATVVRNTANYGAGVYGYYGGTLSNSIVWGNVSNEINNVSGTITCTYSAIEGGFSGEHNILLNEQLNQDPLFVQPSQNSGAEANSAGADWHLSQGSPCVNRGNNSAVTDSLDMDGTARIKRDTVDMGCFESDYYGSPILAPEYTDIIYVTQDGAGNQTGENWGNATSSMSFALSVARAYNADVWVAAGTYYGDTTAADAFTMVEGVNVYGGFAGNEPADYDLSLRNLETNITVLDGQNVRRVLYQPSSFAIQTTWDGFTIQNGYTTGSGGGVYLNGKGKLNRCVIRNNRAYSGGGVYAYSSATVSNCLIANNTASNYGGGVYNYYSTITNATIVRNTANYGAGVYGYYGGTLSNSIVWGNGSDPSKNISGTISCSYSAIEGGFSGDSIVTLSPFNSPMFVNSSSVSGVSVTSENADWHLSQGSPCVNRGNNSAVTNSLDLDGTARIKRDTVDMGCFESDYYGSPILAPEYTDVIYVTQDGAGSQTGENWENATSSILFATTMAKIYHADVWVAAGVYYGDTTAANAFTMVDGVNVYGGFAGNESADHDLSQRDFETNTSILDGQNTRRVLYQPYAFNDSVTTWDGFTIRNGRCYTNDYYERYGGGVYLCNGVLRRCVIKNNHADRCGGGVYISSDGKLFGCEISNNYSSYGGGIYVELYRNSYGYIVYPSVNIINCLISNNDGGGVCTHYGKLSLLNSTIVCNSSSGMYDDSYDYGVHFSPLNNNAQCNLKNCIVWGNRGRYGLKNLSFGVACSYSAVDGGCEGDNNITLSALTPSLFVKPAISAGYSDLTENVDWHLQQESPCINRGNNMVVIDSVDLDGTVRIKRDTVDMGCFESDFYSSPIIDPNYSNIIYVTQEGSGFKTGESWDNATSSLSSALEVAKTNHAVVWMAAGTYYGDTTANSENAFTMVEGVNVYGGFAGNEPADYDLSLRNLETNITVLDGQNVRRVLYQPSSFTTQTTWDGFTIQNGYTTGSGGGVYLSGKGKLNRCVIRNNRAYSGGGVYAYSSATVSNCLIANNTASNYGGGVYNNYSTITNATVVRNTANYGAGVYGGNNGGTLSNSIVWGNGSNEINNVSGTITCTYSAIEGGFSGEHNILLNEQLNQDPLFVQPSQNSGAEANSAGADWHLSQGSPCVNRGNNSAVTDSLDMDGTARIKRDTVDLGCYESDYYSVPMVEYDGIVYMTVTGAGTHSGNSWENATSSIDTAQVLAQANNAVVWVAAGTYYGDTTAANAFTMKNGVNVYGGFAGNEPEDYDLALRDFEANATILDGQHSRRVLYQPQSFTKKTTWNGFTIQNGHTSGSGGGAYLLHNGCLDWCVIQRNFSNSYGGGVYASNSHLENCSISMNISYYYGGGVYLYYSTLNRCRIFTNGALSRGGGLIMNSAKVENSLVSNNTSAGGGGGISSIGTKDTIINSTIVHNESANAGGINGSSNTYMSNCIVWGNEADNGVSNISDDVVCTHCAIGNGHHGDMVIVLNDNVNPGFVSPSESVGISDSTIVVDWHLLPSSPCINRGDNLFVTDTLDLDGTARIKRDTVDLGCYESDYYNISGVDYTIPVQNGGIVYVTQAGAGTQSGNSWENACSSIEEAQGLAQTHNAVVWVAAGTYYGDTLSDNAFTMHDGVNVYGGFAGNEPADYDLSLRDFETNATILDGMNARRVLYQPSSFNTTTTWDGFTIQNGHTAGTGTGGGAYLDGKGQLYRCFIRNNSAYSGGGAYASSPTSVLYNCLISNNTSNGSGGGVYATHAKILNCKITNNTANIYGGGVYAYSSGTTVSNCLITNNTANIYGGGVYAYYSGTKVSNSVVSNNTANNSGGGVYGYYATITNSTIVRNMANNGAGIYSLYEGNLTNSIVWGNGEDMTKNISGTITCSYSAVEGGYAGEQNILLNDYIQQTPRFVHPSLISGASDTTSNVNWHLEQGSPCVNTGDNSVVTDSLDLDGTVRIKRDTVDMGCYESDYYSAPFTEYGSIIYVTVTGAGTHSGDSWANATSSIDTAQTLAQMNNAVVWVASGTYYGDTTAANAFTMRKGINVYGGFAGDEPADFDLSLRDFEINVTILDGQNARRVLYQPSNFNDTTKWDGFTIQNGQTSGDGAGAYLQRSGQLSHCNVQSNTSTSGSGAGIYCSNAFVTNCDVVGNTCYNSGGGIYASLSTVSDCRIEGNASTYFSADGGGGVYCRSAVVMNCDITGNTSRYNGGGVYASNSTVSGCRIEGNTITHSYGTGYGGGGVYSTNSSVISCQIIKNVSIYGGGICAINGTTVSNCLLSGNMAEYNGGGVYASASATAAIANSTIVRNSSGSEGSGIYGSSNVSMSNCIVWGNKRNWVLDNLGGSVTCTFTAVEGGYTGDGNMALNGIVQPLFANPAITAGASDSTVNVDWHLLPGSPCINRGNNAVVTDSLDMDGTARIKRDTVDLGCYESDYYSVPMAEYDGIVYVTVTGAGTHSGNSWENACSSIEVAQGLAQTHNAVVWVAAGTYYGDTTASNAFTMRNGVNVYGGFAGNEPADYDLSLRDFEANATILDGQNARRVLYQPSEFNAETVWNGFTIQNGKTTYSIGSGAGAYLRKNGRLLHSIVQNCYSGDSGGGLYCGSYSSVSYCKMVNNIANRVNSYSCGGGIYCGENVRIINCEISNNTAYYGGGVYCRSHSSSANHATLSGCLILNNTSNSYQGSGVYSFYGNIYNSTIINDQVYGYNETTVKNCIVWGSLSGSVNPTHSAIPLGYGNYSGEGNIMIGSPAGACLTCLDPMFVNPSLNGGDWHLKIGSPCINAGDNSTVMDSLDLDGTARVKRGTVDMGCYESDYDDGLYSDVVYVTATGAGTQTGDSWENAISSIGAAQDIASNNNAVVWVAAGTYYGDTTANNAFTMHNGINVYGGFAGNEPSDYDLSLRDFVTNATILEGQGVRRVLYQPDYFNTETVWDGFTIRNGWCSEYDYGAGAYLKGLGVLSHCLVEDNISVGYGGGLCVASGTVDFCRISGNKSSRYGGGIYSSGAQVQNSLVDNNSVINTASSYNDNHGGGIYGNGVFTNLTVVRNFSSGDGAGVYGMSSILRNCIVWGNVKDGLSDNLGGSVTCTYSAVEGGCTGVGNVFLADYAPFLPMFANPSLSAGASDSTPNVDWHLQNGSVCINRGDNSFVTDSLDLDGTARIKRDTVDFGCYESDYYSLPQMEYDSIIYVTATGAGTYLGNSWENAVSSIVEAQALALTYNAVVWVAAGTYYGDTTSANAFTMREGVNVYGGFAGNEPADYDLSMRDFEANATILDGQNARRVLYQSASFNTQTAWNGFTIRNGQTSGSGAGAYLQQNGLLSQCSIQNNISANGSGGGVYCDRAALEDCDILGNKCRNNGGGVYSSYSNVSDCRILNNSTTDNYGGGVYLNRDNNLERCKVIGNISNSYGGGVYTSSDWNTANISIDRCEITHNKSSRHGGGMYISSNTVHVNNCFVGNNSQENTSSNYGGGGIYGSGTVTNTTIVRNTSTGEGAGVNGGTSTMLQNCIVWGNERNGAVNNLNGSSIVCSHSAIEGGYVGTEMVLLEEGGNSPLFANPSLTAGADDSTANVDWHLMAGSPCINMGDNAVVTDSLDLDGTARIKHDTVDLGCYESDYNSMPITDVGNIIYVTQTGAGNQSGASWANATASIEEAQALAQTYDAVVWVAAGTYYGDTTTLNAFTMRDGVNVYGGFAGNEPASFDLLQRNFEANATILDGQNERRVLNQPFEFNNEAIWSGFTIQNGRISGNGAGANLLRNGHLSQCKVQNNYSTNGSGGGIYCSNASVEGCAIVNNSCRKSGGGINAFSSSISDCRIENDTAMNTGGGIYANSTTVAGCHIAGNQSVGDGGGALSFNSQFMRCVICGNSSANRGGGLKLDHYEMVLNSLVCNNTSGSSGGGMAGYGSVANTTIVHNLSDGNGGGVTGNMDLENCIVWGNKNAGVTDNLGGNAIFCTYSAVEGGFLGEGNFILDESNSSADNSPYFVNPTVGSGAAYDNGDWHLLPQSVCINVGAPDTTSLSETDLDGSPRLQQYRVDLGCYEYSDEVIEDFVLVTVVSDNFMRGNATGSGVYNAGDTVLLQALPNLYAHFLRWSDNDTTNPRIVVADHDSTFTAIFELKLPELHVDSISHSELIGGGTAYISWTVKNDGTVPTPDGSIWYDRVWLSPEPKVDVSNGSPILLGTFPNVSALAPGEYYSRTEEVNIPLQLSGDYYLFVITDAYEADQIFWENEVEASYNPPPYYGALSHNCGGSECGNIAGNRIFEISEYDNYSRYPYYHDNFFYELTGTSNPQIPDLIVASVFPVPQNFFSGTEVELTYQVLNDGDYITGVSDWRDVIFMSYSPIFDSTAQVLEIIPHHGDLLPDSSYQVTTTVSVPLEMHGTAWFYVYTDYYDQVYEHLLRYNNVTRSDDSVNIILTLPADLAPQNIFADSLASTGADFHFSYRILNQGGEPNHSNWRDCCYLSTSPDTLVNAVQIANDMHYNGLAANESYEVQHSVELPYTLTSGIYYLFVRTDAHNNVFEFTAEDNNLQRFLLPISVVKPDLQISSLIVDDTLHAGAEVGVSYCLANTGAGAVINRIVPQRLCLTQAPDGTNAVQIADWSHNLWLNAHDTTLRMRNVPLPSDLQEGVYFLFLETNFHYVLQESDFNNNRSLLKRVYIHYQPLPDLIMTGVELPDTVTAGDSVLLGIHLKNQGEVAANIGSLNWRLYATKGGHLYDCVVGSGSVDTSVIAPGESVYVQKNVFIAPTIFGNQVQFTMVVNANHGVTESIYSNNSHLFSQFVQPYPFDLAANQLASPNESVSGEYIPVSWTVENVGTEPSLTHLLYMRQDTTYRQSFGMQLPVPWFDKVYLSQDSLFDNTDVEIGSYTRNQTLLAGDSYTVNLNCLVPVAADGNYYVLVVSDATNATFDSHRANNVVAHPISVTQSDLPDLQLTSVAVPGILTTDMAYNLRFTVSNEGEHITHGDRWTDAVYLNNQPTMVDAVLLGSKTHFGQLDVSTLYSDSINVIVPNIWTGSCYLIVATDATDQIVEMNDESNNLLILPVSVARPLPCDLTVFPPDIPQSAIAGEDVQISWTVQNIGLNPAQGDIKEAVYLSSDSTWSSDDIMLGAVTYSVNLAVNGQAQRSASFPLQGVSIGDYYVVVKTNILNALNEDSFTNNKAVSLMTMHVDYPSLYIDQEEHRQLNSGQAAYYKLEVGPEYEHQTLSCKLTAPSQNVANGLYVAYSSAPTTTNFNWSATVPFKQEQLVLIPSLSQGIYYIMATGQTVDSSSQQVTILASIIDFEIISVDVNSGANTGSVTTQIIGAKFDTIMDFRLVNSNSYLPAEKIFFRNSTESYATFNLRDQEPGVYDMVAELPGGIITVKGQAFVVELGLPAELLSNIVAPAQIRLGSTFTVTVEYGNDGSTDLDISGFLLVSTNGFPIAFSSDSLANNSTVLTFETAEPNGNPDVIRPGYFASKTIYVKATHEGTINLKLYPIRRQY